MQQKSVAATRAVESATTVLLNSEAEKLDELVEAFWWAARIFGRRAR